MVVRAAAPALLVVGLRDCSNDSDIELGLAWVADQERHPAVPSIDSIPSMNAISSVNT